jgi:hypothetical protein
LQGRAERSVLLRNVPGKKGSDCLASNPLGRGNAAAGIRLQRPIVAGILRGWLSGLELAALFGRHVEDGRIATIV